MHDLPSTLLQRQITWFGDADRHYEGEIKDLLVAKPTPAWRKRIGGQLLNANWPHWFPARLPPTGTPRRLRGRPTQSDVEGRCSMHTWNKHDLAVTVVGVFWFICLTTYNAHLFVVREMT